MENFLKINLRNKEPLKLENVRFDEADIWFCQKNQQKDFQADYLRLKSALIYCADFEVRQNALSAVFWMATKKVELPCDHSTFNQIERVLLFLKQTDKTRELFGTPFFKRLKFFCGDSFLRPSEVESFFAKSCQNCLLIFSQPPQTAVVKTETVFGEVFCRASDLTDVAQTKIELEKRLERVSMDIELLEGLQKNCGFLENAAANVVQKKQRQLEDAQKQAKTIRTLLELLKD